MNAKTFILAIAAFGFLLIGLLVGAIAVDGQYQQSYDTQAIADEPITIDTTNKTPVDAAEYTNDFNTSITVVSGGEELQDGDDYTWYPADGEIDWNASSPEISDGDQAYVSYAYAGQPLSVEKTRDLRLLLFDILPYAALFFVGIGILGLFAGLYKTVKGNSTSRRRRR